METPAARLRSAGPVQNDQDNPPTWASTLSSANRNLFVRGRGGTTRWQRKKRGEEACVGLGTGLQFVGAQTRGEDQKNAIVRRLQPAGFCLSWRCLLEGGRCHWGISIMACVGGRRGNLEDAPPPLKRWLGGPCRESGDEEKIWGRWRTCRETAAGKPWRGGSILNRLSTDLIDGSILGGEWTDRCRCRSAGWVVQVLAAAACSSTSQEKGPREHGCPVEPIPTSPPSIMGPTTRSERARFVCLSTPPHTTQWHPIVKR